MFDDDAHLLGSDDAGQVIIVDTSTSEPDVSRALVLTLADAGHGFVYAPVSGGPDDVATGSMAMIGGSTENFVLASPVMEALASRIFHVGPSGGGNVLAIGEISSTWIVSDRFDSCFSMGPHTSGLGH